LKNPEIKKKKVGQGGAKLGLKKNKKEGYTVICTNTGQAN